MRLKAPPWTYSNQPKPGEQIVVRKAPTPTRMILPAVYGRTNLPPADAVLPEFNKPPDLKLERYKNVALLPHNIVLNARTCEVMGPTFSRRRINYHGGLAYIAEQDAYTFNPEAPFGEITKMDLQTASRSIDGPLYYADTEVPFVYGHVLLEVLTRLWALRNVSDNVQVATSAALDRTVLSLMASLGVNAERLIHIDRPMVAECCFFPTTPIARRKWIHPAAWEVFERLKRLAHHSDIAPAERIFLSRARVPARELLNQRRVEAYFKAKGFLVVHLQDLRIEDQIRLISNAKLIAGPGGSAMHTALFARDARVLILSSEGWLVNADILLSQKPSRLGYVFGTPIEPATNGHRTLSPWRIDMNEVREAVRAHFDLPHEGPLHAVRVLAKRVQWRANEIPRPRRL